MISRHPKPLEHCNSLGYIDENPRRCKVRLKKSMNMVISNPWKTHEMIKIVAIGICLLASSYWYKRNKKNGATTLSLKDCMRAFFSSYSSN
jgi:hypothetical protein